jgi:4-hydroxyphenylpyruvate dioxygenase-like putative hemolysin
MTFDFSHDHIGITVAADRLDDTIEWYSSKLGFTVDQRFESHGTTFVYIVAGNVKIELLAGASNSQAQIDDILTSMDPSRLHHFCIAVEDVDAAIAELGNRGVPLIGGPMDIDAIQQRVAFITDNLGNIIELMTPGSWLAGQRH